MKADPITLYSSSLVEDNMDCLLASVVLVNHSPSDD